MPYKPEDLMQPTGYLTPSMFPGKSESQRTSVLEVYLAQGYVRAVGATDVDASAFAWAHYRAFTDRVIELSNQAASIQVPNEVTVARTNDQLAVLTAQAKSWLERFDEYFPVESGEVSDLGIPPSGSSKTHVTW